MASSKNGWRVEPPRTAKIRAKNGDTADVRTGSRDGDKVNELFQDFINEYHRRVEAVRTVSGYRTASANAGTGTPVNNSNHRSATAIDINGFMYPYEYTHRNGYRQKFTGNKLKIVRALIKYRYSGIIRWGHDFDTPYRDEMHYEIAPGVTNAKLAAVLKRVRKLNKRGMPAVVRVKVAALNGRSAPSTKADKVVTRRKGYTFIAYEKTYQNGRWWYMTKYGTFYAAEYCTVVRKVK